MSDNIFGTASTPSLVSVAEAAAKVMKLDEHCGVCDEQGLEEKVNLKKLKKDYLKNEDENRHTENYLMLAKAFGTPAEVKKVQEIMKRNEKQGSTSKTDSDWMYKNINKYYDKIRNEEVEIDEAVLAGKDYKYDGKVVKISKKNFSKVHKDFKNSTKGKERMLINDPKTGGSISVPVQFEEMGNVAPTAPDSGGIQYQAPVLGKKKKKEIVSKRKQYLKGAGITEEVQRTTFAGKDVFIVDSETFYNCRLGKKKYGRYEKYVGDGLVGQTIREYGLKYPRRPIILQNGESGPMLYLKYGRS